MKRAAILLAAVLSSVALASCDRAPTSAAPAKSAGGATVRRNGTASASAEGVVRFTFGSTTEDLSFLVSNSSGSVTTGYAMFWSHTAGVVGAITVTCLNVSGSTATFLGTVTASSDASIVGDDAYWQVVAGSPAESSLVNLAASGQGPSCTSPTEFDLVNVSKGHVTLN